MYKASTQCGLKPQKLEPHEDESEEEKNREMEALRSGQESKLHLLSSNQKTLLKESFEAMEDASTRNGVSIFIRLFQEYPNYKSLWPQFQPISDSVLMDSTTLRTHADIYMSGLRAIVSDLDDEKALNIQLKKIAMAHTRKGVRKFHIDNMLPTVLGTLKCCLDILTPEVEDAWTALFAIISEMVEEFKEEEKKKKERHLTVR